MLLRRKEQTQQEGAKIGSGRNGKRGRRFAEGTGGGKGGQGRIGEKKGALLVMLTVSGRGEEYGVPCVS